MKTLYEIFKILDIIVATIWFYLTIRNFRYLHDFLEEKNDYKQLLFLKKIAKRSCFFALFLGIICFILTALEFFLKIELQYNFVGFLALGCYFFDRYRLNTINKSIEYEERFNKKK